MNKYNFKNYIERIIPANTVIVLTVGLSEASDSDFLNCNVNRNHVSILFSTNLLSFEVGAEIVFSQPFLSEAQAYGLRP